MSTFASRLYDGAGSSRDRRFPDLTQEQIGACEFRAVVKLDLGRAALVKLIVVAADDATAPQMPKPALAAIADAFASGGAVLVLARVAEAGANIREGVNQVAQIVRNHLGEGRIA